jgi:UDP-N-acetyl-D-mannosaminuronate dehydrogenase
VTDHDAVDYHHVATHSSLVIDSRGVMRRHGIEGPARIIKA